MNRIESYRLSKLWLYLGVFALALSGFFALFLVIGRSPYIYKIIPHKDFFKSSLTIHVNLSILVWLLSVYASIVAFGLKKFFFVNKVGLVVCAAATVMMCLSILDFNSIAFTNNYIPFTSSKIFAVAMYTYFVGIVFVIVSSLLGSDIKSGVFSVSVCSSIILIMAITTFEKTWIDLNSIKLSSFYNDADFYELLFWGSGHLLMFTYSSLLIYAWFTIARLIAANSGYYSKMRLGMAHNYSQILNVVCAAVGLPIAFKYDPSTFEYVNLYTKHMISFAGIAPMLAVIFVFAEFLKVFSRKRNFSVTDKIISYNLLWSYVLFLSGGVIAMLIEGSDTRVPAHYHGSIIGISIALMGLTFLYLKTFGYKEISSVAAKLQPHFYGGGQLVHIIGLAISGGYGALRKTPGMAESLEGKLSMGLMGIGGLFAIIGGLCFVIAVIVAVTKPNHKNL